MPGPLRCRVEEPGSCRSAELLDLQERTGEIQGVCLGPDGIGVRCHLRREMVGLMQEPADRKEKQKIRYERDNQTLQGVLRFLVMSLVKDDRPELFFVQDIHELCGDKDPRFQETARESQGQAILEDRDVLQERKSGDIPERNGLALGTVHKSQCPQDPQDCPRNGVKERERHEDEEDCFTGFSKDLQKGHDPQAAEVAGESLRTREGNEEEDGFRMPVELKKDKERKQGKRTQEQDGARPRLILGFPHFSSLRSVSRACRGFPSASWKKYRQRPRQPSQGTSQRPSGQDFP